MRLLGFAAVVSLCVPAFCQTALPSLSDPTLSPDGREITFASGGDLWTVPAVGGQAHLLVTNPATQSRPLYSPDGSRLAFVSKRTGGGNIYILTLATGSLQRLTYSDGSDNLNAWSPDGKWIYFTSAKNDIAGQGDIFRVASSGGTPLEVSNERYLNEFEAAPSPDGRSIALMARGISSSQWWRNGHSHIDNTSVWLKPVDTRGGYKRLLPSDAKHAWPMWSADGKTLFYMSDGAPAKADGAAAKSGDSAAKSDGAGVENIWEAAVDSPATAHALTHFRDGRVLWPSIGDAGRQIVFERGFAIWRIDTTSGKAEQVPITLHGTSALASDTRSTETKFRTLSLSPDGKKLAVTAHGQLFATSAKEGGEALRLKSDAVAISQPAWSPDSRSLVYVSEQMDGTHQVEMFTFDPDGGAAAGHARKLTPADGAIEAPTWSPDGKSIAYVADGKTLYMLMVPAAGDRTLAAGRLLATGQLGGYNDTTLAWSPDSRWVAFAETDQRSFRNVWVVPAAGGEALPISFLANGETASKIAWSPDGKFILFDTSQRSERVQMARVDLLPHVPLFREDEFRKLFDPGKQPGTPAAPPDQHEPGIAPPHTPAAMPPPTGKDIAADGSDKDAETAVMKKVEPVKIVFDGIRERLTLLPLGIGANAPVISPDGKLLLFTAESANQQQLYTYSLDEGAKEPPVARQLTSTPGQKKDYAFAPDSKSIFYLANENVKTIVLANRSAKSVPVSARVDVDFDSEKKVVFEEAWSDLNRLYYDPKFNGADWARLRDTWQPYINGARTSDELRRDINLLIGEMNSSHSGIGPPRDAPKPVPVGNLGLRFDRKRYEAGNGLIIAEVITLGPAFIEGSIKPGDRLVSIDGEPVGWHDIDQMLEDTVNHRVVLGIETAGKTRDAVVRPVGLGAADGLLYRQWVNDRRALVEKMSGGKIGYVHMADMSDGALQQLYLDLDAQNESKQGVIIDIRNNDGGYINGYALDVLTRRNYLEMTPRGMGTWPSRQSLGQRALGLPTVLVTNESSLSDAEDFTEGYRSLQLGKVVGEPTAGWIIFTDGVRLIDGSALRLPFIRVQDLRGQTMEMHPRPVDIEVQRELGETESHTDAQLARAVAVLLESKAAKQAGN